MRDPTPVPAMTHRRLDRYEVIAEIAKGGMGTVLLARLAGAGGFQRLFAVKLLHAQYAMNAEFIEMLLDEARIAARIHHPNVVGTQEISESDEHGYYVVMDYVEGFPLSDALSLLGPPAPARWRLTNRVLLDALKGLQAAHELTDDDGTSLAVVHRDISPQNILIGVDGIGRVTDFGLAKAAARMSATRAGQVKGKIAYMSPEQARGEHVDARTDIFATGIVLWESLTGQRLFKRETDAETYKRVLSARVPRVSEVTPEVPDALVTVCARALERVTDQRFRSSREMAQALERAARANDLLADSDEVGAWLRTAFAPALQERRVAIRAAASAIAPSQTLPTLRGELQVPQLPESSVRLRRPSSPPPEVSLVPRRNAAPAQRPTPAPEPPRETEPPHATETTEDDWNDQLSTTARPTEVDPPYQMFTESPEAPMPLVNVARNSRPSHGQLTPAPVAPPSWVGTAAAPRGGARTPPWMLLGLIAVGIGASAVALVVWIGRGRPEAPAPPAQVASPAPPGIAAVSVPPAAPAGSGPATPPPVVPTPRPAPVAPAAAPVGHAGIRHGRRTAGLMPASHNGTAPAGTAAGPGSGAATVSPGETTPPPPPPETPAPPPPPEPATGPTYEPSGPAPSYQPNP